MKTPARMEFRLSTDQARRGQFRAIVFLYCFNAPLKVLLQRNRQSSVKAKTTGCEGTMRDAGRTNGNKCFIQFEYFTDSNVMAGSSKFCKHKQNHNENNSGSYGRWIIKAQSSTAEVKA